MVISNNLKCFLFASPKFKIQLHFCTQNKQLPTYVPNAFLYILGQSKSFLWGLKKIILKKLCLFPTLRNSFKGDSERRHRAGLWDLGNFKCFSKGGCQWALSWRQEVDCPVQSLPEDERMGQKCWGREEPHIVQNSLDQSRLSTT